MVGSVTVLSFTFMRDIDAQYLGSCPVCSAAYTQEHAAIVQHTDSDTSSSPNASQGGHITFHVDCAQCASSVLVAIRSSNEGLVTTIGMPTDLTKKDVSRLRNASYITSDEVLDLHTYLEKNEN